MANERTTDAVQRLLASLPRRERTAAIADAVGRLPYEWQRALWRVLARHLIEHAASTAPRNTDGGGGHRASSDVLALLHSDLVVVANDNVPAGGSSAGLCAEADGAEHRQDVSNPERTPRHNIGRAGA